MDNKKTKRTLPPINYSDLMDLRIDYAFKLLFTKGDSRLLISLLNAIFANKKIPRTIESLAIKNPYLEKESSGDKLSILDIRAQLDDGTAILIEMHMYNLGELKSKSIRSWARAYGEELEPGKFYSDQPPTVSIAFTNGNIVPDAHKAKIHKLCMIMDCEDNTVFTNAMELHYIDMKAFAEAVNEKGSINISGTEEVKFSKWLSVITQKDIADKTIIEDICEDEEDISMAVSTLAKQGEDKYSRQAYQRRQDEIYFFNMSMQRAEEDRRLVEEYRQRSEEDRRQSKEDRRQSKEDRRLVKAMAERLLSRGDSIADIAAALDITEQDIAALLP